MKKILLLVMTCLLLPRTAGADELDGTFELGDLKYQSSSGLYYFDVSLNSNSIYSAYNMDIFFPTGITVAKDANDNLRVNMLKSSTAVYPYTTTVELNEEDEEVEVKTYNHTIGCSQPNDNQLRISCIDMKANKPFTKTSGSLFRVYVSVDTGVLSNSFSPKPIIKLSGLNLTTADAIKYVPADFACRPFATGIPTERTLNVNVSATNKIGTLILPFDAALPQGLKAYTCNATEDDVLTLVPVSSLEACKPYIVYAENGYTGLLTGTATLPDVTNVTDVFAEGFLTGVLTGTTVSTGYILQNQGSGPMFYNADGVTFSLPAGRCYLTPNDTPAGVRAFNFNFDIANDIETIDHSTSTNVHLYDLFGRKVDNPTHGIYLQGTRKLIVK